MSASANKTERILLVLMPIVLIFEFLQGLFFPATERPSAGLNFLSIAIHAVMVFSLAGLVVRRLKADAPIERLEPWLILAGIGVLAGVGIFVVRFSGRQSELPPRSTRTLSEPSQSRAKQGELDELVARLEAVANPQVKAQAAVLGSSWAKATREERRKLSRKELQDFLARERELIVAIDKVIELMKEPGVDIKFARLISALAAQGHVVPPSDIHVDVWRLRRGVWAANEKLWTVVDAHWEEWRADPGPAEGEPPPWRNEMADLEREGDLAQKEYDARFGAAEAPPIEAPTLVQGGGRLAAVVHDLRRQFGDARVFKEITITRDGVGIVVRDSKNPARTVSDFRDHKSLAQEEDFKPSSDLLSGGDVRESELFGVDEADWTRVAAIARAGLEKIPLPKGRVIEVDLVRRFHPLQENAAEWTVEVKNGGLLDGENGKAYFDARSGDLTELELPKSLMKSPAYLVPANTQTLLAQILQDFGPETRFIEFSVDDNRALLTATRPKHPDDLRRYGYTATERAKLGKHNPIPVQDPKARNGIFTAAEVSEFVPKLDRLRQRAFERLKMKDGRLTGMAFWRQNMVHGTNKKLLLELRCDSPTVGDGVVIYEVSGKEFYVALP
jgi:hypothetical protein